MKTPGIHVNAVAGSAAPAAAEETLPRSRRSFEAHRFSSSALRSTRFLVAISAVTALLLALVVVLGFQLLRHILRGVAPGGGNQCVEGDDDGCRDDQTCVSGRCMTVLPPLRCQVGDPCASKCEAAPVLRCGEHGKYVAAKPATSDVCADANVARFLTEVGKKCGSLRSCETHQLAEFAIDHADFMELMTTFPGMAVLHFNSGKPSSSQWPAPGSKTEAHYIEGLAGLVEELGRAQTVLLVALSSRDTPKDVPDVGQAEDTLTLARANAAERLVLAAARGTSSTAELDALDNKIKFVLLGKRKQLDADFYDRDMVGRSVTWDPKSQDKLRSLIEAGDKLLPRERRWRDQTINQTVFIVPIPCGLGAR